MRNALIALTLTLTLVAVGCGGGNNSSGSTRKTEATLSVEQAPTATNDAGLQVRITKYKQTDRYLVLNLSLTNTGKETVLLKNGDGPTLPGFRAAVEGQTYMAENRKGSYNVFTGYRPAAGNAGTMEIPAGVTATMELHWKFQVSRKDYDWTVVIANMFVKDQPAKDIALSWPPAGAAPAPAK